MNVRRHLGFGWSSFQTLWFAIEFCGVLSSYGIYLYIDDGLLLNRVTSFRLVIYIIRGVIQSETFIIGPPPKGLSVRLAFWVLQLCAVAVEALDLNWKLCELKIRRVSEKCKLTVHKFLWLRLGWFCCTAEMHLSPSWRRRGGEEAGKSRIGVNYGQLANSVFCRMWIVIVFSSFQWRSCSFQPSRATFARLISGVSCLRAEWRPQPAQPTLRYGAMRLMACTCLTGTTPVAASVWNASRAAERAAAVHGWGSSFPNDLQFYDRQAQGGWNLVSLEVCLERFLCFCLGGLMRSADLRI